MVHIRNRILGSILSKIYQSNKKELQQRILIPLEKQRSKQNLQANLLPVSLAKLFPPLLI